MISRQPSFSLICFRYALVVLCITMFIIQVSQAVDDQEDSVGFQLAVADDDNEPQHDLTRRTPKKVAQMLQQMLQRGEMQVEPYRIHKFLGRLQRRKSLELNKNLLY